MKILLAAVNAKYIHSNLAVYSLRASAGAYRELVELAEYTINLQKDTILEDLYKRQPDVLCFSCYIWNLEYVEAVSAEFHKLCPQVPIWVGGPEVSYEVEDFLKKHPQFTGVMIGEGEDTFRELCGCYQSREYTLYDVAGLAFREEKQGDIVFTKQREIADLRAIPFCYDTMEDFSNRIIYYESSRGCPFSCSYCLSSVDKKLRFRDLEQVKQELQFFLNQEVPQVKFVDRTFNCNHTHAMEIWKFILEQDNGITNFHFEISADLLREEELQLISQMRPGLIQLEIGVQSVNEVTIREIHRTMKLERLKEVVKRIQAGGNIHQHLDLIAGLPYEDYESFRHSFDEIYALMPDQLQLGFLKVLKGSYMYEHVEEYGILYHETPPYEVLRTSWLTYDDLLKIRHVEEMLEVYYNSGQYEIAMKLITTQAESMFDFLKLLGDFYEERGYASMNHSRIRRCEILLEFLAEGSSVWKKKNMDREDILPMMEEALVFDLYFRENCKSRPSWAVDMTSAAYKEKSRQYCSNGKMSHVEPFHYHFPGKRSIPVETLPERLEEPEWVLFHYDDRDPLDHQARTEWL